ncbi:hypothetical protein T492DRAFT_199786 [Pavlovales sp. CCMP2436]|nr:hypothetical protein T492DRAFT_199786 [Pavlovales sp. CCMP2436]
MHGHASESHAEGQAGVVSVPAALPLSLAQVGGRALRGNITAAVVAHSPGLAASAGLSAVGPQLCVAGAGGEGRGWLSVGRFCQSVSANRVEGGKLGMAARLWTLPSLSPGLSAPQYRYASAPDRYLALSLGAGQTVLLDLCADTGASDTGGAETGAADTGVSGGGRVEGRGEGEGGGGGEGRGGSGRGAEAGSWARAEIAGLEGESTSLLVCVLPVVLPLPLSASPLSAPPLSDGGDTGAVGGLGTSTPAGSSGSGSGCKDNSSSGGKGSGASQGSGGRECDGSGASAGRLARVLVQVTRSSVRLILPHPPHALACAWTSPHPITHAAASGGFLAIACGSTVRLLAARSLLPDSPPRSSPGGGEEGEGGGERSVIVEEVCALEAPSNVSALTLCHTSELPLGIPPGLASESDTVLLAVGLWISHSVRVYRLTDAPAASLSAHAHALGAADSQSVDTGAADSQAADEQGGYASYWPQRRRLQPVWASAPSVSAASLPGASVSVDSGGSGVRSLLLQPTCSRTDGRQAAGRQPGGAGSAPGGTGAAAAQGKRHRVAGIAGSGAGQSGAAGEGQGGTGEWLLWCGFADGRAGLCALAAEAAPLSAPPVSAPAWRMAGAVLGSVAVADEPIEVLLFFYLCFIFFWMILFYSYGCGCGCGYGFGYECVYVYAYESGYEYDFEHE